MKAESAVIMVLGPTAAGKSDFAEDLAARLGGEILNADSQQFYRGLDIGTGKVPAAQRRVRHRLLDLCAPGERMTAMEFTRRADAGIAELSEVGKPSLVVGGTGLYLKALLEGLDELPARDPTLRDQLRLEYDRLGGSALHRSLADLDPVAAAKISPQDPSRLIRYLEIGLLTGRPPSELMRCKRPETLRYRVQIFWLQLGREAQRQRIADRVARMLSAGWFEEVRSLMQAGMDPRRLEAAPIGYAEVAEVLDGKMELETARQVIVTRTQQYAKRQETFFRGMLAHPPYRSGGNSVRVIHSELEDFKRETLTTLAYFDR